MTTPAASRLRETEMRQDVLASIRAVIAEKNLDFIPGSADLGDFDATSTTIALDPGGEQARLPAVELARTFDIYWERFEKRASNRRAAGNEYTPYEWRVAGSFVRLGRRDRAQALFDFFMADRRPSGWNHWAEVVWNEPRMPRFIGDMPHGWVGSDFLRSFLDLFAYEGAGGSLVLGAGPSALVAPRRGRRRRPGAADALRHARRLRRAGGRRRAVPDRRDREAARGLRRGVAARRPALRCPRGRAARRARSARTRDRALGAGGDPDAGAALMTAARRLPSNRYGHFSEDGREFVVTDPRPPRPWTNVIANERVGLAVSHTGSGFSWIDNSQLAAVTRWQQELAVDRSGKFLYACDADDGAVWSLSPSPVWAPLDRYACRHGFGYTVFETAFRGLEARWTLFCDAEATVELWKVELADASGRPRRIDLVRLSRVVHGRLALAAARVRAALSRDLA